MVTTSFCAAIVVLATLAGLSVKAQHVVESCYSGPTIEYFKLSFLCGRVVTTQIVSGVDNETLCVICSVECVDDVTATVTQYTVRNGVESEPDYSTLSYQGYGKLIRVFDNDPNNQVDVFIVSYTQHIDGTIKLVCIQCSDSGNVQFKISFICDYPAIFVDELDKVKCVFPYLPFTIFPGTCAAEDYFPVCKK